MSSLTALRAVLLPLFVIITLLFVNSLSLTSNASSRSLDNSVQMRALSIPRSSMELKLGYCGNGSLNNSYAVVTDVVIVIHGDGRNACSYATSIQRAADRAGKRASTLVVAPHFPIATDTEAASNNRLYWSSSGWKTGADSKVSPRYRPWAISSFEVVDLLVDRVMDRRQFKNLKRITIAGHSAGGQFVNRYLATTKRPAEATPSVMRRWIVANPSSYLYLDGRRVRADGKLATPSAERRSQCPDYNTYKYGLEGRPGYAGSMSDYQVRARVAQARVTYMVGSEDTDPDDSSLDTSCAGALQGPERYSRAVNHRAHLQEMLSAEAGKQPLIIVNGVGHSARAMFTSAEGVRALFE